MEKICRVCRKTFESGHTRRIYCSKKCQVSASNRNYHRRQHPLATHACLTCGAKFESLHPRKKFCADCRRK